MTDSVYRRDNCRLCGSRSLENVLPLAPTPLADAYVSSTHLREVQQIYPLDLYLCKDCGFAQLLDIVIPHVIYLDYIYETVSSLGLVDHFRRYADDVVAIIKPPQKALVVDIGSNDGSLLRFFKKHGMCVLGVDPAREIARRATAAGIETLPEFFNQALVRKIKKEHGSASIVTANNLYANVDDLDALTTAICDLLTPDGVFIFESFYLMDWMQNMVFDFTYHEHLSYFSVKPLASFFRRHGMELIDVKRVPTKGGSARYTIQRAGGPRPVSPAVAELIALETKLGLQRADAFKSFAARIDNAKKQLLDLINSLQKQGKTIAGYGASATTTTLIYHFELGDKLRFIADDYETKQNLYSPGYHIPVLTPQSLYERKPDYVLILAWRYAEPIIKKHKAFLEQGGKFIVPLPDLRIV
ncbi:class I SAM-dependent methyltransferase [Patescibacteria group bacterium]|nr:class I SAM-dependent methyltransferase [Patescibacteria group bacterium]